MNGIFIQELSLGGRREYGETRACTAGRSVSKENVAWTKPQTIPQGRIRGPGCVASGSGEAQHLGSGVARRVLEVRGASEARGGQAWLACVKGQQFLPAAGKTQRDGGRLERRQET